MLEVNPDTLKILATLEAQQKDINQLLGGLNPAVSIDTHTYFYLRDAAFEIEKAIRSFKTAYCNMFY